ncbi:hypothetical protein JYU34_018629, partial [Plutella xylostella]
MTSKVVKCKHCNIVIDEVLAFIQNKIQVIDDVSLVQICKSAFKPDDIKNAKSLLFDSVNNAKKIIRKGDGKSDRDLEDIISLLRRLDPELVPIFVARDLEKLPPVTFDHVDVTKLLKDLLLLQKEVKGMKDHFITTEQFEVLKMDLIDKQSKSIITSPNTFAYRNVNVKRGACVYDSYKFNCDSGPIGLQNLPTDLNSQNESAVSCQAADSESSPPPPPAPATDRASHIQIPSHSENGVMNAELEASSVISNPTSQVTLGNASTPDIKCIHIDNVENTQMAQSLQKPDPARKTMAQVLKEGINNESWSVVQNKSRKAGK